MVKGECFITRTISQVLTGLQNKDRKITITMVLKSVFGKKTNKQIIVKNLHELSFSYLTISETEKQNKTNGQQKLHCGSCGKV